QRGAGQSDEVVGDRVGPRGNSGERDFAEQHRYPLDAGLGGDPARSRVGAAAGGGTAGVRPDGNDRGGRAGGVVSGDGGLELHDGAGRGAGRGRESGLLSTWAAWGRTTHFAISSPRSPGPGASAWPGDSWFDVLEELDAME